MALDHFVSQVHLRKFYAPTLNCKKMYAWRKSKPDPFFCDARDVCRIDNGSTNEYIAEPRAIEEFLRLVEPRYNEACVASLSGILTFEDVLSLAGFVAFIIACSPTAIRLGRQSIAALVDTQARLMDQQGLVGSAPKELGKRGLSELLDDGSISINVDGKFTQSIGIAQEHEHTNSFGDSRWEFVTNPFEDSPFLTSDFPVCVAPDPSDSALRRFIPLRPDLGAYVTPSRVAANSRPTKFENFRSQVRTASRAEVRALNQLVVQCAEDMVFSNVNHAWIGRLVERNARFSLAHTTARMKTQDGYYTFTSLGIREEA
jgi:hypothetical protein